MACRVCRGVTNIEADGRCRGCRIAKAATDGKTSYGKLESRLWMLYGDQLANTSASVLPCPICGNLFLPRTTNQKYCSNACAVKAAQAAYRKRKRTQAFRAPVDERKEPDREKHKGTNGNRSG